MGKIKLATWYIKKQILFHVHILKLLHNKMTLWWKRNKKKNYGILLFNALANINSSGYFDILNFSKMVFSMLKVGMCQVVTTNILKVELSKKNKLLC